VRTARLELSASASNLTTPKFSCAVYGESLLKTICVAGAISNSPRSLIVSVAVPSACVVIESPAYSIDCAETTAPFTSTGPLTVRLPTGSREFRCGARRAHVAAGTHSVSTARNSTINRGRGLAGAIRRSWSSPLWLAFVIAHPHCGRWAIPCSGACTKVTGSR